MTARVIASVESLTTTYDGKHAPKGVKHSAGHALVGPAGTTLEHDPDSGCLRCPLDNIAREAWCDVSRQLVDDHHGPAPDWCPLRAGPVTVRRKEQQR